MHAAVEHVKCGTGREGGNAVRRDPLPQRDPGGCGQRPGQRHRGAHGGVGAQPLLFSVPSRSIMAWSASASEVQGRPRRRSPISVLTADTAQRPPCPRTCPVTIAAFHRFPRAGRGAGRYPGAGRRAVRQPHRDRQGGPPAGVEDLQGRQFRHVEHCHHLLLSRVPVRAARRAVTCARHRLVFVDPSASRLTRPADAGPGCGGSAIRSRRARRRSRLRPDPGPARRD